MSPKLSFSFFNQCCNICIKKWYYYCNKPSYITLHGKFAIYQCIIFLLINITFMLSFKVTTQAFPSWNSLRKEGLHVILHVLKENYNHHIADFRVFGCRTHINAFTKFCQIPCSVKAERSQHYVLLRAFQSQIFVQETAGQKGAIPCQNRQKDENGTF